MTVTLPDGAELELADGATGLDAARAIGPKLAEQAVLVRLDGRVQDLRLPLPDGAAIQILTTRDRHDPDALAVLRHSAAHLLAEAARRLYPGTKVAIGPPIEDGFYYDFEFPVPIHEDDLERLEEEIGREIAEGRAWERFDVDRDEARRLFEAEGEPYKVELVDTADGPISFYRQGDFTDLCRGPHLQNAAPIKAVKLLSLAGAYWRGDATKPQLTRVYGTAFFDQKDLDEHLHRLEEARRRDHRRLGRELDLVHFDEHSPGSPLWHPKGMVIWNALEDVRRRENAGRGYLEVKTPLMYDTELWQISGHWEKYRDNMFLIPQEEKTFGLKPMNCPGHMLLFGSQIRSYRELPVRFAEASTLHRDEPGGTLHGLLRVRHVTQDDAHIFCSREQIEDEIFGCLDYVAFLYDLFGMDARFELSTRPENKLGTDEEWDFTEEALKTALERKHARIRAERGRRRVLRAEDRPPHDGRAGPVVADGHDPARLADAPALRSVVRRSRQPRAHALRHPPGAARLARALHRHSHRALRRRLPGLAGARAGPGRAGRRSPPRRGGGSAGRARRAWRARGRRRQRGDDPEAHPGGRAREDPLRRRLRRQGGRGRHPGATRPRRPGRLRLGAGGGPRRDCASCYPLRPASRSDVFLTSGALGLSEVQPRTAEEGRLLRAAVFVCVHDEEEQQDLVKAL